MPTSAAIFAGAAVLLTCLLLVFRERTKKRAVACATKGFIPLIGPASVPLLGRLEALVKGVSAQKAFAWSSKCGPVIRVKAGFTETVILNDLESVKAFLNHKDMLYRSPSWILSGTVDLGFAVYGAKRWEESRRHSLDLLRMAGFGKPEMETIIAEECQNLRNCIAQKKEQPVDLSELVLASVNTVVCRLLFDCRCPVEDPSHQDVRRAIRVEFSSSRSGSLVSPFPPTFQSIIRRLAFTKTGKLLDTMRAIRAFAREHIRRLLEDINDGNHSFVKMYLLQNQQLQDHDNFAHRQSFLQGKIEKELDNGAASDLVGNTTALLLAGTLTVSAFLTRLLLRVAANVDTIQARIQGEIDAVTGCERQPRWEDRYSTPYTMAVIWESHRLHTVLPLGLPRFAGEDVVIGRYFVRKGSTVIANIWAVHKSPDKWTQPEIFDPGRFLKEDGSLAVEAVKNVVPFSVGKRSCPGEGLAPVEIYLFLTCTLQKFCVPPQGGCEFDATVRDSVIMQPGRHLFRCIPRTQY